MATPPDRSREKELLEFQQSAHGDKFQLHYYVDPLPAGLPGAFFWGNMWDSPKPGEHMRYWSWVSNNGDSIRTQLTITAFFGPGCLFPNVADALPARDAGWPMLNSAIFSVKPGDRVKVEMGHRLPTAMLPGFYMLNLLLWESNNYNQPAKLWDRMHLRFQVKE